MKIEEIDPQEIMKVIYFLQTANLYSYAVARSKYTECRSFDAAQRRADLVKACSGRNASPLDYMRPVEEVSTEALSIYEEYKTWLEKCPWGRESLVIFCKWYNEPTAGALMLRMNVFYIVRIFETILKQISGHIDDKRAKERLSSIIEEGKGEFRYCHDLVMGSFIHAVKKIREIEWGIHGAPSAN